MGPHGRDGGWLPLVTDAQLRALTESLGAMKAEPQLVTDEQLRALAETLAAVKTEMEGIATRVANQVVNNACASRLFRLYLAMLSVIT